jgi:hypothetical protein
MKCDDDFRPPSDRKNGDKNALQKQRLCDVFKKGYSVQAACDKIGVNADDYCKWFESDVLFRVQVYRCIAKSRQ